jgi:S1-C subfamily serine protease
VASNTALYVLTQILQHGRVRRASLGIEGATTVIPRHLARFAGIDQASGIRVMALVKGGPAEGAEIKPGDLIIAIDDHAVEGIDDLLRLLDHERVQKDVKVTLLRKGERRDRYVSPVERLP